MIISRHVDWSDTFGPLSGSSRGGNRYGAEHLKLATGRAARTIRLNSRTLTDATLGTDGTNIGFQSKPGQGVATSNNVIGCEISPRVNNGIALTGSGSIIGAHIDAYLRGTTGNIAGDVRGLQVELVTDDAGTRTIAGNVSHVRLRSAFSGTITGKFSAFRVEKPETQTNSKDYDFLFQLTGAGAAWPAAGTVGSQAGALAIQVNGATKYIGLYDTLS